MGRRRRGRAFSSGIDNSRANGGIVGDLGASDTGNGCGNSGKFGWTVGRRINTLQERRETGPQVEQKGDDVIVESGRAGMQGEYQVGTEPEIGSKSGFAEMRVQRIDDGTGRRDRRGYRLNHTDLHGGRTPTPKVRAGVG